MGRRGILLLLAVALCGAGYWWATLVARVAALAGLAPAGAAAAPPWRWPLTALALLAAAAAGGTLLRRGRRQRAAAHRDGEEGR
ncbi:MAG TPA: hypothetical protein VFW96_25065 [Thermomicrobiales bacterium]|nr:hypothetical protein [Thermomicrobiales bacterium]